MGFKVWSFICLSIWISLVYADHVCYDELGCFNTNYPWSSILRPFPIPVSPEKINTTFYFAARSKTEKIYLQTWPQIEIHSQFDERKPSVIITHGLNSYIHMEWVKNLTEAFLHKNDYNVFLVQWEKGAAYDYLQASSNIRIVAAEIIRLVRYLIANYSIDLSQFHLVGHSLGAHIMSYVGKNLTRIGRITALDPARPGFQGKNAEVRLDNSDAKFVDVIHTDGKPFLPFLSLGMSISVGTVDFFVNGGRGQPGCLFDGKAYNIFSIEDITHLTINVIYNLATCSHSRAVTYMAIAIKEECKMWGYRYIARYAHHHYENFILENSCSLDNCTLMGLETPKYPARGNFAVKTSGIYPYCIEDPNVSQSMENPKSLRTSGEIANGIFGKLFKF